MLGGIDYRTIAVAVSRAMNGLFSASGSSGQIPTRNASQPYGLVWTDYTRQVLNVNPNFLLDQIKEGAAYTQAGAGSVQGPDGVTLEVANTAASISIQQVADPDNAARKALKITVNGADAVVDAADRVDLLLALEGYDTSDLSIGTASASQVVVMLKHKLPAGTYGVSLANSAGNRSNVQTVVATGNEMDSPLTFSLDTAGTWLYTNGVGLYVRLCLMGGANFQTVNGGQWLAANNYTTAAQFNFAGNVANVGYIKKWHVIPGGVALAYAPADVQRELAKGQRQYFKTYEQGTAVGTNTVTGQILGGNFAAGAAPAYGLRYPVPMRASPSLVTLTSAGTIGKLNDGLGAEQVASVNGAGATGVNVFITAGSLIQVSGHLTANARLA